MSRKPPHGATEILSADLYRDPRTGLEVGCDRTRPEAFQSRKFHCDCGFVASATTERTLAESVLTHACSPIHDEAV